MLGVQQHSWYQLRDILVVYIKNLICIKLKEQICSLTDRWPWHSFEISRIYFPVLGRSSPTKGAFMWGDFWICWYLQTYCLPIMCHQCKQWVSESMLLSQLFAKDYRNHCGAFQQLQTWATCTNSYFDPAQFDTECRTLAGVSVILPNSWTSVRLLAFQSEFSPALVK